VDVDRRVVAFLRANKGKLFCSKCLSLAVARPDGGHINQYQARNAVRPLKDIAGFIVEENECSKCGEIRQIAGAK